VALAASRTGESASGARPVPLRRSWLPAFNRVARPVWCARPSGNGLDWGTSGAFPAQIALPRANIRFMFHAMVTRLHSPRTLSRPRSRNWRNPSADLMMPNTGSGIRLRKPRHLPA